MKYYKFLFLLLVPLVAWAGSPPNGKAVISKVKITENPDYHGNVKHMIYTPSTNDKNLFSIGSSSNNPGDIPRPLWGTDKLVSSGSGLGLYLLDVAMDVADNGDIYVAVAYDILSGYDTVVVWKSTDNGIIWNRIIKTTGELNHSCIDLAVGPGSNPLIFLLVEFDGPATYDGLWLGIATDTGFVWSNIVDTLAVENPALSIDNNENIAIAFVDTFKNVYRGASTDLGVTWDISRVNMESSPYLLPAIFLSDNGRGYHAYTTKDSVVWLVSFDLPSLAAVDITSLHITPDKVGDISIAASGGTPSNQRVISVWENIHTSTSIQDIHYATSNDGGTTWSSSNIFPPTNFAYSTGSDMWSPWVHRHRNDLDFRFTSLYTTPSGDSVFYAFSSSATSWPTSYDVINDHYDVSIMDGPRVDYCPGLSGGCVVYNDVRDSTWFDYWNATGISEGSKRQNSLKSMVLKNGIFSQGYVKVFTADGRLIKEGSGYIGLPKGVYFLVGKGYQQKIIITSAL